MQPARRSWLVTGATGLLGSYLVAGLKPLGQVTASSHFLGEWACDLTNLEALRALMSSVAPDVVIHAGGFTDVDACERAPQEAFAVNRDGAANVVAALPPGARLVFISTDQVYPDTQGPHAESEAAPINVYGKSKLAAEETVLAHPGTLVLRTNFFGPSLTPGRHSLSDFVVRSLNEHRPVTFFQDILFSPLRMTTLAALVVELVEREIDGVFNAGSRNGMSKAEFAFELAARFGLPTATAKTGNSSTHLGRAPRPRDLRMDVSRLEGALGRLLPTLSEEIAQLPPLPTMESATRYTLNESH